MTDSLAASRRTKMLRYAGWLVAISLGAGLIGLLAFGLLTRAPDSTIDDALSNERPVPAPGFALELLHRGSVPLTLARRWSRAAADGTIHLDELRGTPVVLNFWASWCLPCRDEAPLLQRAWTRYGPDGVLFVGQNMQDVRSDAREFIAAYRQTFPSVRDPSNDTARAWGATGIPETFFIGRDGAIVGHVIGAVDQAQLARGVQAASAGRVTPPNTGGDRRPTR